jgi:hypothetical protein
LKTEWARVARTVLQALIGLAPFVPELVAKLGVNTTVGVWAGVILVAGTVTRIMQIPIVDQKVNAILKVKEPTT